ncbi:D-ribose pyranase [Xenorhabdus sp. Vera]|uniref:RbsD/FucU domain-containing protein n=1 Tax=Xenorhabdus koppenhoeferi TaxID=351659 RepID=UPI0019B3AF7A|nr:RbsD/FucU domain-containing protein [Xenorhabdus sp. Vera]MBD2809749.1 D-ribose pyranase [Xenorhabdus sp. Vera]
MKKGVLLNSDISAVTSRLGHTDQITISDAGLPIPSSTQRINLALTQGIPDLLSVFDVVVQEIQQGNAITVKYVSHNILKAETEKSKVGSVYPYANILLCSDITF